MLTGVTWGYAVSAMAYDEHAVGRQAGGGQDATAAECLQCGGTYAADPGWRRVGRLQSAAAEAAALTGAAGAARGGGRQPSSQRQSMAARALSSDTPAEAHIHAMIGPSPAPPAPKRTAPPPTAAGKNPGATRADLLRWAAELGIAGDLDGGDDPLSAAGESALSRRLRADVRARACETLDIGRLRTALGWAADFRAATRRIPLFRPLRFEGDLDGMRYNQATLDALAEYIRQQGSKRRGRGATSLVASDTIQSYVGVLRLLRGAEAGYAVTSDAVNVTAPAALKRMRQVDAPAGERVLERGMRASMLRRLAQTGFDRSSPMGTMRWAAALLAHNLVLRGGELCVVTDVAFDSARDIVLGSVDIREPCAESDGCHWMTVDVTAIKDGDARNVTVPMPVRRRSSVGAMGADPMCTYDAVLALMRQHLGRTPVTGRVSGAAALRPMFTRRWPASPRAKSNEWRTADTNKLAKEMAAALGQDESEFGGKSFRIGGATDIAATVGMVKAERLLRERGRWKSDVAFAYKRALATDHLRLSAGMADAQGRDLEAMCAGWSQPSTFR